MSVSKGINSTVTATHVVVRNASMERSVCICRESRDLKCDYSSIACGEHSACMQLISACGHKQCMLPILHILIHAWSQQFSSMHVFVLK